MDGREVLDFVWTLILQLGRLLVAVSKVVLPMMWDLSMEAKTKVIPMMKETIHVTKTKVLPMGATYVDAALPRLVELVGGFTPVSYSAK